MTNLQLVAICVIFWTVVFDALRDCFINDPNWLKRHTCKWLAWYPIIGFVAYYFLGFWGTMIIAPISWIIWQLTVRYIGKKKWESMWIRWIKGLCGKERK